MIQVYDGDGTRQGRARLKPKLIPIPRNCYTIACVSNKPGELSYHTENASRWFIVSRSQALRVLERTYEPEMAAFVLSEHERISLEGQIASFEERDRNRHLIEGKIGHDCWRSRYSWTVAERLAWNAANPDRHPWSPA